MLSPVAFGLLSPVHIRYLSYPTEFWTPVRHARRGAKVYLSKYGMQAVLASNRVKLLCISL